VKPPVGESGPVPPLWGWSRVDGHAHAIDPGGEHPASVSLAPMSDPGRKFLDLLCATVTLGAFRSVLAEVVAVAEEAANLSDEQLRSALVSLDHAARRLVGGEAVSAYWVCSSIDSRADRLVFSEPAAVRGCLRSLSGSVTGLPGRWCVPPARNMPLVVARVPAGRWLRCPRLPVASRSILLLDGALLRHWLCPRRGFPIPPRKVRFAAKIRRPAARPSVGRCVSCVTAGSAPSALRLTNSISPPAPRWWRDGPPALRAEPRACGAPVER
jgi:hypothetical protein